MLTISFGDSVIDASNATIERLVLSRDLINDVAYKTVFFVIQNANLLMYDVGDIKTLHIEDSTNNLIILHEAMTLQNIEISEKENNVSYLYTFREEIIEEEEGV